MRLRQRMAWDKEVGVGVGLLFDVDACMRSMRMDAEAEVEVVRQSGRGMRLLGTDIEAMATAVGMKVFLEMMAVRVQVAEGLAESRRT